MGVERFAEHGGADDDRADRLDSVDDGQADRSAPTWKALCVGQAPRKPAARSAQGSQRSSAETSRAPCRRGGVRADLSACRTSAREARPRPNLGEEVEQGTAGNVDLPAPAGETAGQCPGLPHALDRQSLGRGGLGLWQLMPPGR